MAGIKEFIKEYPIDEIKEHPNNPRVHPDSAIDKLTKSIETYGFINPIIISNDGILLAGHARKKASEKNNQAAVPALIVDLEGDEADGYLLADNRLQEDTKWEKNLLRRLFEDLGENDFNLELTGFDDKEIGSILEDEKEEVEPELEFTEELMEEHNYIVLYFDNSMDWQAAKDKFGITTKQTKWSDTTNRSGVGRVVRGADFLD